VKKEKEELVPIGVRIPKRLRSSVRKEAADKNCRPSDIVRDALERRYKKVETEAARWHSNPQTNSARLP